MSFLQMGLIFLVVSLALLAATVVLLRIPVRLVVRPLLVATAVLFILTAIFDNVMIAVGLFDYGEETLTGLRIGLAPVEDFLYPLCAVLFMPAFWWLLGGTRPKTVKDGGQ